MKVTSEEADTSARGGEQLDMHAGQERNLHGGVEEALVLCTGAAIWMPAGAVDSTSDRDADNGHLRAAPGPPPLDPPPHLPRGCSTCAAIL